MSDSGQELNHNRRDEEAALWCIRLADEPLAADSDAFDLWLEMPGNADAFEESVRAWQAIGAVSNTPELINMRSSALESVRRAHGRRWMPRLDLSLSHYVAIAAALVCLVLAYTIIQSPDHNSEQFLGTHPVATAGEVYQTDIGKRRVATLSDGSRVSLDAGTEVKVAFYNDQRILALTSGRAKFDVAKDPSRPFRVAVKDKLIVATGTSFSVELVDNQVHVLLYEGTVEVLDRKTGFLLAGPDGAHQPTGRHAAAIAPGQELVTAVGHKNAQIVTVDALQTSTWENGQLNFDNETLQTAIIRANRYSTTKLSIGDDFTGDVRISGVFKAGDTAAFIEGITEIYPVRATKNDQGYMLSRK